jgi:hypothetical protein
METNKRLRHILTIASLVTQASGFSLLGSVIALKGGPDCESTIGGILAILIGTTYFTATLAYWIHCRRLLQNCHLPENPLGLPPAPIATRARNAVSSQAVVDPDGGSTIAGILAF